MEKNVYMTAKILKITEKLSLSQVFLSQDRDKYKEGNLVDFYKYLDAKEFSNLKQFACKFISMFGTTYKWEQTFSSMKYLKSKYRAYLSDDHLQSLLVIGVTDFNPNYKQILQKKKIHSSIITIKMCIKLISIYV